jgi:peptide/nickel transport system substrate-binding protein
MNVPKFLKIGEPFDLDIHVNVKNQSNVTNGLKGNIDYFVSDRNNKIVVEGSSLINSSITNQSNKEDPFQTQKPESGTAAISLNASQTQALIPGPAKIKLIVTSEESPKPLIQEKTLIVRP